MTTDEDLPGELTVEDLEQGIVKVTEPPGRVAVGGKNFDQRIDDLVDEIDSSEWKQTSVKIPNAIAHTVKKLDSVHTLGVYKTRTAMMMHGHDYLSERFAYEFDRLKDSFAQFSPDSVIEAEMAMEAMSSSAVYEIPGGKQSAGLYISEQRSSRMSRQADSIGLSKASLMRHCMAVSALSTNVEAMYDDMLKKYAPGLERYIRYWAKVLDVDL